jgi:integrase
MAKRNQTRVSDLFNLVTADYRRLGKRSLDIIEIHIKRLEPYFAERVANLVSTQVVNDYIDQRQQDGAANATINREMAVLKRGYNLGLRHGVVNRRPYIEKLPEAEPREDFFEYDEFRKFETALRAKGKEANWDGNVVADVVVFAYFSGWRLNEVLQLNASWIKADLRLAILPAAKHKNKKQKVFPLEGEVWNLVSLRLGGINNDGLLFHRNGKPIKSVRKIFQSTCREIKLDKKKFHALRRSLVTNLNRADVPVETGKKISGHRTTGVYQNYNQVTVKQLRDAVIAVNQHLGISPRPAKEKDTRQNIFKKGLTSVSEFEKIANVNDRKHLSETETPVKTFNSPDLIEKNGGEGGIRTPETLSGPTWFRDKFPVLTSHSSSLFSSLKSIVAGLLKTSKGEE